MQDSYWLPLRAEMFVFSILFAISVYFFPLSHFVLPIDGEFQNNFLNTVSLGRWGHAFLRAWLLPEPFIPYFTLFLSLVFLSFSSVICCALLNLSKQQSLLFCLVFMTSPQLAYQLEFINQADTVALGYLLMVLGVCFFYYSMVHKDRIWLWCLTAVPFWVYGIGIYQALVVVPPILFLGMFLFNPQCKKISGRFLFKGISMFALYILLSMVLYLVLSACFQNFILENAASFNKGYLSGFYSHQGSILNSIFLVIKHLGVQLSGNAFYGSKTLLFFSFTALANMTVLIWRERWKAAWQCILIAGILIVPFCMGFVTDQSLPARVWVGINLSSAIIALLAIRFLKKPVWLCLFGLIFFLHVVWVSALFSSDFRARTQDVLMANRIVTAIYRKYPAIDLSATPVYFHGGFFKNIQQRLKRSETFGGSFFAWDGGNNWRLKGFFAYYGVADFIIAGKTETQQALETVDRLPAWPNTDSIELLDSVLIVKLGENRGWLPFKVGD